MSERPPSLSARLKFSWKLWRVFRANGKRQFDRALTLLEEADKIRPLRAPGRVYRAALLLKAQRTHDAHVAFAALRDEFKGSDDPDRQYLRHYCTYQLSWMSRSSGQWSYEAKQAKLVDCRPALRRRFPMLSTDDIHDRIQPRV